MSSAPDNAASLLKLSDGLGELEVTIGAAARPVVAEVRRGLVAAAALHADGKLPEAIESIRHAMAQLTQLADQVDPAEGMLMRLIAERFAGALSHGDKGAAKATVNFMRHRAGDPKDDPNSDW